VVTPLRARTRRATPGGCPAWRVPRNLVAPLAVAALAFSSSAVVAQEPSVRAYLSPGTEVAAGRPFVLNVEISGTQAVDRDPALPDLSAFAQFLGSSTQSSVSMVNGRTTVALTIQYRYQSVREGVHVIPAFEVRAGGRAFTTQPMTITVSSAPAGGGPDPSTGVGSDDLFITAEASTRTVREGQPFVVEYRIWTRVDVINFGVTRVPEPEGFWVEDLTPGGQPDVEQRTRNGAQYATALVRRVALVPTGPGMRTIEPVGIEAQVRVRRGRDPFEDFFGRSSLFGAASVPVTVSSDELAIEVQPLPPGRPEPFSGMVGTLRVEATLDRDSVNANEAVTLTVRAVGDGNVRVIPEPVLDLPADFEVFPPEVSENVSVTSDGLTGARVFEYVLIPRAPGRREIPSVRYGYFDRSAGAYRTAESASLPLIVSGTVLEGPAAITRGGVAQLREDIRFIRLGSLQLRRVSGGSVFGGVGFWLFLLLPMAGVGGALAVRRHQDRLLGDVAFARGRRAGRLARKRLAEARRLSAGGDPRAFYAEMARALRGLLADRLNLAEAGLQTDDVDRLLAERGVDASIREEVRRYLEHCDRQRFAPPGDDPEEKERFLERAADLMTRLDRGVR
jgi:hypothetical protein